MNYNFPLNYDKIFFKYFLKLFFCQLINIIVKTAYPEVYILTINLFE